MKCYYHPTVDAVALCKSCSRALCFDCSADVHPGIACKDKCEEDVASLNILVERGKTAYQKTGKAYKQNSIAMLLMGLIPFVLGIIPIVRGNGYSSIIFSIVGAIFILWAFFSYQSGKQIQTIEKKESGPGT